MSHFEEEAGEKKKKKINGVFKIFLISGLVTAVVCAMLAVAGVVAYNTFIYNKGATNAVAAEVPELEDVKGTDKQPTVDQSLNKTIAVFGTDKAGSLTDVILVVHFNSQTNKINIVSVPRDTKVEWSEAQINVLPKKHQWVREGKINEMTSWGGIENIRPLTISTLETMLGVKIDNYVVVNLDAFRQIVDAIDGVEVEVKQRMKKDDYSQNLHIDLYPGVQVLDGDKAEQFVRFRSYRNGDLGRIEAQQQFLEAFTKKVLSPEIITKVPKIIPILFTSIQTDISLTEIPSYYPYLSNFNMSNLQFNVLPGEPREENKLSYFFYNREEVDLLVEQIFF